MEIKIALAGNFRLLGGQRPGAAAPVAMATPIVTVVRR